MAEVCKEVGCETSLDVYKCRGYCLKHYRVRRLAGEFGARPCIAAGCRRHAVGIGLCELHRNRHKRTGALDVADRPKVGVAANSWRGGRNRTDAGYVLCTLPPDHPQFTWGRPASTASGSISRSILEHRLVMGIALGRPLRKDETVHHINGLRDDNRIENLQLRIGAHGPGTRHVCTDCGSQNIKAENL